MAHLPTRKKQRLEEYDYSTPGTYFITICSKDRSCVFWEKSDALQKTEDILFSCAGNVVERCIQKMATIYNEVTVDHYCVMYDHVHLLITIHKGAECTVERMMNQLKRAVSKELGVSVWQKSYYDHIIRDQDDYNQKYEYIQNNPLNFILKNEW